VSARQFVGAAAIAVSVSACASVGVERNWDPDYDFSGRTGYAWIEASPNTVPGSFFDRRFRTEVDSILASRGLAATDRDAAALLVSYGITTRDRRTVDTYGYGTGSWWGVDVTGSPVSHAYTDGTLVLDVIDARTRQLVWRGTGSGTVDAAAPPEERLERAVRVARKLLSAFPPGR
jgi:hypothetical protein